MDRDDGGAVGVGEERRRRQTVWPRGTALTMLGEEEGAAAGELARGGGQADG